MAVIVSKKKSTIISEGSDKPNAPKERHYVNNEKFYEALVERRKQVNKALEEGKPIPPASEYIGHCILKICQNMGRRNNFSGYTFLDEMIDDAVFDCVKAIDKFDPEKSKSPFSYFSQAASFAFINRLNDEKKRTYRKFKMMVDSASLGELATEGYGVDDHSLDNVEVDNQYMREFVDEYERKVKEKKELNAKVKEPTVLETLFGDEV